MADEAVLDPEEEKKQIKEEKKALKKEQKEAQKEAKARAKEIAKREDELLDGEDDAGGLSIAMVTIIIIVIWIAILALLIKLDVGGLGSTVMRPLIKDVPVLNAILPAESSLGSNLTTTEEDPYMGFSSLEEAVAYIRQLEREMAEMKNSSGNDTARVEALEAEIDRLKTFEKAQVDFQRIRKHVFYIIVYAQG